MGFENNFNKPVVPVQEKNIDIEKESLDDNQKKEDEKILLENNFNKFNFLMGEKHYKIGEKGDNEIYNDFEGVTLKEMNLNKDEFSKLKSYIDDKIASQEDGLYKLKSESINFYKEEKKKQEQIAENERLAKLTPEQRIADDISKTESIIDLSNILSKLNVIKGSQQDFKPEQIVNLLNKLLDANSDTNVKDITRTYGLREKAISLVEEKIMEVQSYEDLKKLVKKLNLSDENNIIYILDEMEKGKYYNVGGDNIMNKAKELFELNTNNKKNDNFNQLINDGKGSIKGKVLGQTPGGSYIVETPQGKMEIDDVKEIRQL